MTADLLDLPTFRFRDRVRTYHLDQDCKRHLKQHHDRRLRDELAAADTPYPCTACALPRAIDALVCLADDTPDASVVACCRMAQPTVGWQGNAAPSAAMLDDSRARADLLGDLAARLGGVAVDVQDDPWVRYALVPVPRLLAGGVRNTVGMLDPGALARPDGAALTGRLCATLARLHEDGMPLDDALAAAAALDG